MVVNDNLDRKKKKKNFKWKIDQRQRITQPKHKKLQMKYNNLKQLWMKLRDKTKIALVFETEMIF